MANELVHADTGEVVNPALITPVADVDEVLRAFAQYQELKEKIAGPEDMVRIGNKMHPTKSFVRKVQKLFNLSCEIVSDEPIRVGEEIIGWATVVRATYLPTGAFQDGDGACELEEKTKKNQKTIHNVRAHAMTRAKNRAVLDLVGFGEVSADEINETPERNAQPKPNSERPEGSDPLWPWGDHRGERLSTIPFDVLKLAQTKQIPDLWADRIHQEIGERP